MWVAREFSFFPLVISVVVSDAWFPHAEYKLSLRQLAVLLHWRQEHDARAPGERAGRYVWKEIQHDFRGTQGKTFLCALCYNPGQFSFLSLTCVTDLWFWWCPVQLCQAEVLGRIKDLMFRGCPAGFFGAFLLKRLFLAMLEKWLCSLGSPFTSLELWKFLLQLCLSKWVLWVHVNPFPHQLFRLEATAGVSAVIYICPKNKLKGVMDSSWINETIVWNRKQT